MGNSIGSTRGRIRSICSLRSTRASSARGMYPGYEQYWGAILANPEGILPFTGKVATKGEIAYAQFAERTPHIVLSRTLDKVAWKNTRIVRDVEEIRRLKQQPGKDMHAVGGATLVGSLINAALDRRASAGRAPHHPRWGKGAVQGRQGAACVDVSWRQAVGVGLGPSDLQVRLTTAGGTMLMTSSVFTDAIVQHL